MSFLVAMQVLGTALSVQSAMQKGKASNTVAQMNAEQETMRLAQEKIISMQKNNDRLAEFDRNSSVNEAFFAFLGRDSSDASYKAFQKSNKKMALSDVKRQTNQSLLEQGQIKYAREQHLYGGKVALQASKVEAFSSAVNGLYNYNTTKIT
tara:strand:+ start:204 stop:656 length:453 start_codon:yes stop_codon:yes gene_type:complete